jgi:hypothetical protein
MVQIVPTDADTPPLASQPPLHLGNREVRLRRNQAQQIVRCASSFERLG